jgi:hypothetical protein
VVWFEPIRLPESVLAENAQCLRDRDAGALLRLARRHAGASQLRLAAATGLAQGRISRLSNGRGGVVTSLEVWERIAGGLNLPDSARAALGLAAARVPDAGTGPAWPVDDGPGDDGPVAGGASAVIDLDRTGDGLVLVELPERGVTMAVSRRVLLGALALGSTAGVLADVRPAAAGVVADEELLAGLTAALATSQVAGRVTPPARLVDRLTSQVAVLDVVRHQAPERLRRDYLVLQAQYGEYLSWLTQESGELTDALYWVDRAQQWAGLADWPAMTAYAHVRRSTLASSCAGDGPAAVEHATQALQIPHAPPRIVAEAAKQLAYGHALAGQRDECHRALDRIATLFDRASAGDGGPDPIIRLHAANDPSLVARSAGTCDIYLGDGENAIALLESSQDTYQSSSRAHAITGARLTQAYAQAGSPDVACRHALDAVDTGEAVDSLTTRNELRRALAPLSRWRDRDDVTEVHHRVTTMTT